MTTGTSIQALGVQEADVKRGLRTWCRRTSGYLAACEHPSCIAANAVDEHLVRCEACDAVFVPAGQDQRCAPCIEAGSPARDQRDRWIEREERKLASPAPKLFRWMKIHYTGDQANPEGNGLIAKIDARKRDGVTVDLYDGRTFQVNAAMFEPGPGRRFMPRFEHEQTRARVMFETYGQITCSVHVARECWQPEGPTTGELYNARGVDRKECPACYEVLST